VIQQGADAASALADFLVGAVKVSSAEAETLLDDLETQITGPASPIPAALQPVVGGMLTAIVRTVRLAPHELHQVADAVDRATTGD
jgi:hypothetical protein